MLQLQILTVFEILLPELIGQHQRIVFVVADHDPLDLLLSLSLIPAEGVIVGDVELGLIHQAILLISIVCVSESIQDLLVLLDVHR